MVLNLAPPALAPTSDPLLGAFHALVDRLESVVESDAFVILVGEQKHVEKLLDCNVLQEALLALRVL